MRKLVLDLETTFSLVTRTDGKVESDIGTPFNPGNRAILAGVYDFKEYKSYDLTKPYGLQKLKERIANADILIGHNIKYDALWLKALGIDLSHLKYRDTMLREYLIWQGRHPSLGLDATAPRYGGTPKMNFIGRCFDKNINVTEIPRFILAQYLYDDVMNTAMVYEGQLKRVELSEQSKYDSFYHDVLEAVIEMEWNGAKFNDEAKDSVSADIEDKLYKATQELEDKAAKYVDKDTFNPNSSVQLSKIIYGLKLKVDDPAAEKPSYTRAKAEWQGFASRFKPWEKGSQSKLEYAVDRCFDRIDDGKSLFIKPDVDWLTDKKFLNDSGVSTGSKVIDAMLNSGKLTKKQEEFVAAVQAYSKASTWKESNLAGVFNGLRPDGYVHGQINMHVTSTRRFSSSNPNCFPYDVEFLTEKGFMTFDSWDGEKVAQVDYDNDMRMTFDAPVEVHKYNQHVMEIGTRDWRVACTPEHRMLFQDRKTGKFKITSAVDTPQDMKVHNSYCYSGGDESWPDYKVVLFAAFQADGHRRKQDGIVEFKFSKDRKIERLKNALDDASIPYRISYKPVTKGKDQTKISISRERVPAYFTKNLSDVRLYSLSLMTRIYLAKELLFWDGDSTRLTEYYCKSHKNATWAQELFSSIGWRANIRHYDNKKGGSCYIVALSKKGYSMTTNRVAVWRGGGAVPVWCFTMPKGTLVVRYKGKVTVTGNCQNWPREGTNPVKKLVKSRFEGGHIVCADYAQLEFRGAGLVSGDKQLIEDVSNDFDIHSHTATLAFKDRFTNAEGKDRKELRTKAKTKTFEFQYGATPKTKIDQAIYDAFYGKYYMVKAWQEKVMCEISNKKRYVCPFTGVVFAFDDAGLHNEYKWGTQAKNYPIQFLADCINKCALVGIYNRIKHRDDIKMILTVHDSNVLDAAPEAVEEAKQILQEEMTNVTKVFERYFGKTLDVPLGVDVSSGKTWYDQE